MPVSVQLILQLLKRQQQMFQKKNKNASQLYSQKFRVFNTFGAGKLLKKSTYIMQHHSNSNFV